MIYYIADSFSVTLCWVLIEGQIIKTKTGFMFTDDSHILRGYKLYEHCINIHLNFSTDTWEYIEGKTLEDLLGNNFAVLL